RVELLKTARTALPQIVGNTRALAAAATDATEVPRKIEVADRDLDSNLTAIAPEAELAAHAAPGSAALTLVGEGAGEARRETGSGCPSTRGGRFERGRQACAISPCTPIRPGCRSLAREN